MTRRRGVTGKGIRKQAAPMRFVVARDVLTQAAPHVVTHWLGDPQYRAPGQMLLPRRIRLRGSGPSLSKLIRRVWPTGDIDEIAAFLVQSGSVRRVGPYFELENRFIPFRADSAAALSHTVKTVRSYVDTVAYNMACTTPQDTWVERSATNRHIPSRATPTVRRFLRRQVAMLTSRVDAYLRRWEVEPGSEPTVEIGVNAFAHSTHGIEPGPTSSPDPSTALNRRPRRRGRTRVK
jgi:hypothetical protein